MIEEENTTRKVLLQEIIDVLNILIGILVNSEEFPILSQCLTGFLKKNK